jgi:hypothetical protein
VAEALAAVDASGERFYEAELHRLKGELTLQAQAQRPEASRKGPRNTGPRAQRHVPASLWNSSCVGGRRRRSTSIPSTGVLLLVMPAASALSNRIGRKLLLLGAALGMLVLA